MHKPSHFRNQSSPSYDTNIANYRDVRSHNKCGNANKIRTNRINSNRYSCGDFSLILNQNKQYIDIENRPTFGQGND